MGKTELILFGTKRKIKQFDNYSIACCGHTVTATKSVKYLGLEIDQTLSGEQMATEVIKKVNARLRFLYRQAIFFLIKKLRKRSAPPLFYVYLIILFLHGMAEYPKLHVKNYSVLKTK